LPFGQYTDDSQLARELLRSYAACQAFDPADYAGRVARLFGEGRVVGRGIACDAAARRLLAGVPWHEAGEPAPSAGNGTAMRAAPVGLFCWDDPDELIEVSRDQSRITHRDPRCAAGAVAIAGAVALGMQEAAIEPRAFLGQLAQWASTFSAEFARLLLQLDRWLTLPPEEAAGPISRAGVLPEFEAEQWPGISPFVVGSVLWSLYAFLRSPDDYWETVCTAIAVGGDVDTTGAMAGAVSGAHVGLDALPHDLTRRVNDMGEWGYDNLVGLADECYDLVTRGA
jgi:ADP-ribosylglycohydrolase